MGLHISSKEYKARHPLPFLVLPGGSDYMLPALVGRQSGAVTGPGQLYPKVMMKLFNTSVEALETGNMEKYAALDLLKYEADLARFREAQALQDLVTEADGVINRVVSISEYSLTLTDTYEGFLGIKTALDVHVAPRVGVKYLGGAFRKPLQPPGDFIVEDVTTGLKKIFEVEDSL